MRQGARTRARAIRETSVRMDRQTMRRHLKNRRKVGRGVGEARGGGGGGGGTPQHGERI